MNNTFNKTKYTTWYFNIINKAKDRNISGYKENHHIIPKSLGGSNKKSNMVNLTAREHYIVHMLLPKMVEDQKHKTSMWYAAWCMLRMNTKDQHRYKKHNSKLYNKAKQEASVASKNYWTGRKRPWTEEQRQKQSIAQSGKKYTRSEEYLAKQKAVQTGIKKRPRTEEEKKAHSEKIKALWANPEFREKMLNSRKKSNPSC